MTSAGMLSVSHIIHIIPTSSDRQAIKTSLEKGLLVAKQSNIRSVTTSSWNGMVWFILFRIGKPDFSSCEQRLGQLQRIFEGENSVTTK